MVSKNAFQKLLTEDTIRYIFIKMEFSVKMKGQSFQRTLVINMN